MKTKTKLQISVTKDDIAKGVSLLPGSCPVALAAKRKGITRVTVSSVDINGWFHGREIGLLLPAKAKTFVHLFDLGQPVKPFRFTLSIPLT